MRYSPDFYFDSASQVHLDDWARDRVVLVGDAAHSPSPLSGQGTSLTLAGELRAVGGDHRVWVRQAPGGDDRQVVTHRTAEPTRASPTRVPVH
jgi:FAD binding domain